MANTAELVAFSDANLENNSATVVTTMFGLADLSVEKTGPARVEIGQGPVVDLEPAPVVRNEAGPAPAFLGAIGLEAAA